jgi:hypothetical protein
MNNYKPSGLRIDVFLLFLATLFIAWMYTLSGCTQGGIYGVYEGITNITQDLPTEIGILDSDSNLADDITPKQLAQGTDPVSSTTKKKKKSFSFSSIGTYISNFFTGKKSNFDNMGTQFRNIQFDSTLQSQANIPDFFNGVTFSSKCCPSMYSSDSGCACLGEDKYNIIKTRAGNNLPVYQW